METKVIGYLIWWRFWDLYVNYEAFQKLIDKVGIDYQLPPLKGRTAFLKAVQEIKRSYANKGIIVRKLYKAKDWIEIGVMEESVDREGIAHTGSCKITYVPATGSLQTTQPINAFDMIKQAYHAYISAYNANDIRVALVDMLRPCLPISFRQNGGLYFVAEKHYEMVRKLEQLVACLPGKCVVCAAPQIDTPRTRNAMAVALVDTLEYQIGKLESDIGTMEKPGLSIPAALYKRYRLIEHLKKQMVEYRDLNVDFTPLKDRVDEVKRIINKRLYIGDDDAKENEEEGQES